MTKPKTPQWAIALALQMTDMIAAMDRLTFAIGKQTSANRALLDSVAAITRERTARLRPSLGDHCPLCAREWRTWEDGRLYHVCHYGSNKGTHDAGSQKAAG